MSATSAVARGRRMAIAVMLDTCIIQRVTGEATDPVTGAVVPTYTVIYTGKCKVQSAQAQEVTQEAGSNVFTQQRYTLHVPPTAGPVTIGDVATITVAAVDPQLVGNQYRVTATFTKSLATAQRLSIEEGTG